MKAAGTNLRQGFLWCVWFLSCGILLSGFGLILYDSDVGGGRRWRPLPLGGRGQVFELPLLPPPAQRAAS